MGRGERPQLIASAENMGEEGMEEYKARKNRWSVDGLAGLKSVGESGC